ncbi:putative sucrose/H+ symporter, plant, MFS transporter superfamily [Dioscorea sansibarensis]
MEVETVKGVDTVELGVGAGEERARREVSLVRLVFSCMVAGGVQYGWALQLSLLTPYVQTLGLPHSLSSIMWLCGPIAGFLVQPTVGLWSDRCYSKFGRRRPFILVGCLLISTAVLIIGFSSDIGFALGDTKEHCSVYTGPRWKAAIVYVAGFWVLDLSNNAVQGPARALMADLAGPEKVNAANAIFCSWMAAGNILGYSSGASGKWHKWFPFLNTKACCAACANLKGAFLVAVIFLLCCVAVTVIIAQEVPLEKKPGMKEENTGFLNMLKDIFGAFKSLPAGMPSVLLVTAVTWLSWFPFILYDTDWMGREVYHGNPDGTAAQRDAYDRGVRQGAFGLLLNSVVLGISSFLIEPLCRKLTPRVVWVISNFSVFAAMAGISIVSKWSVDGFRGSIQQAINADPKVRAVALFIFTALGFPLAVLFSVPFAVTAQLAAKAGRGQGLCTGVLNIFIVLPQVIIALGAGPWDALFGKGNLPAFALAAAFAFVCGFLGIFILPKLSRSSFRSSSMAGMH